MPLVDELEVDSNVEVAKKLRSTGLPKRGRISNYFNAYRTDPPSFLRHFYGLRCIDVKSLAF